MKFVGKIGFIEIVETSPGIYEEKVTEIQRTGDVLTKNPRWVSGTSINDTLTNSSRISIVADKYITDNESKIRYVVWRNSKWKVTSIDSSTYPRIVLEIGGVYNG